MDTVALIASPASYNGCSHTHRLVWSSQRAGEGAKGLRSAPAS